MVPSWTHEDTSVQEETGLLRRARHFNSGVDEASFASGVPHHTPDLAVSEPGKGSDYQTG
ncbi:hypothetical protein M9458_043178, partial [Cirrhinus mrigala]